MSKVVSLADKKFLKSNAGKIVRSCDLLDEEVRRLVFEGDIPPGDLLVAYAQRLGVYVSCVEEKDREKLAAHLAKVILRYAMKN